MNTQNIYNKRWWTLAVLVIGLLVIGFDTTILTVALPVLAKELQATTTDLQWIMNSYILLLAACLLAAGTIGDKFGRKGVLLVGLILFGLTSVMAGLSKNTEMLIVSRGLMGIAGAIILPLTMSIVPTIFPEHEREKAISIWAAGMGVGLLIGPLIGGYLLEHFTWQAIFFINIPIIIITLIGTLFLVPESKDSHAPKLDWKGMILSGVGLMLIVYGLTEGPEKGWLHVMTISSIVVGLLFIILFVFSQKTHRYPMLDLALFKNKRFTWATIAGCVVMFVLSGLLFFVTQYMEFFFDFSPLNTGIKLMPLIGMYVLGSLMSNIITKKLGTKWVIAIGLTVLAIGLYVMANLETNSTYSNLVISFIIQGFGMGLMLAPAMDAVMESLPQAEVGIGSAVNNALRQVGGTFGIALIGSIISHHYEQNLTESLDKLPQDVLEHAQQSLGVAKQLALKLEIPMKEHVLLHAGEAFLEGMKISLLLSIVIVFIGIVTTILFLPSVKKKV